MSWPIRGLSLGCYSHASSAVSEPLSSVQGDLNTWPVSISGSHSHALEHSAAIFVLTVKDEPTGGDIVFRVAAMEIAGVGSPRMILAAQPIFAAALKRGDKLNLGARRHRS